MEASPRSAFVLGFWLASPRATPGQRHHPRIAGSRERQEQVRVVWPVTTLPRGLSMSTRATWRLAGSSMVAHTAPIGFVVVVQRSSTKKNGAHLLRSQCVEHECPGVSLGVSWRSGLIVPSREGDSDTHRLGGIQTPRDWGRTQGNSDTHRLGGDQGFRHPQTRGFRHPQTGGGFRHPQTWGFRGIQTPTDLGVSDADLWRGDWPAQRFAALGRCSETRPIVTADVCARSLEVRRRAGCSVGRRTEVIGAHEAATLSERERHGDAC